jgi:hypothetical protein
MIQTATHVAISVQELRRLITHLQAGRPKDMSFRWTWLIWRRCHQLEAKRAHYRKRKGEFAEAIGRSRGGRTSKISALADDRGGPVAFAPAKAYKRRNLIERMFCKLRNWRRVATRYDRHAQNYLSGLALAAIVVSRI